MKVTFPHMGNMYISVKVLLETLGIDYVIPPNCNKQTLEYGVANSPEFACLPFKTMLGDFIHGINQGADVILFGSGCGQCRLGYYGDLHTEILKSLGYNAEFKLLELNKMSVGDAFNTLKPLASRKSPYDVTKGVAYALITVFAADGLYKLANFTRCREVNKGETDSIMKKFESMVRKSSGFKGVRSELLLAKKALKEVRIDRDVQPLKVAIVGEIYTATDHHINLGIESKLGSLGVEVYNTQGVSMWINEHFIKNLLPFKIKNNAHEAGKEFMKTDDIGGHGLETIGNSILFSKRRFDGIIHLYPFTCMPEIIAQTTFSKLQKKYNIPIMTLILDEMTGEAGYMTRIEAFVDMLERRRASALEIPALYKT